MAVPSFPPHKDPAVFMQKFHELLKEYGIDVIEDTYDLLIGKPDKTRHDGFTEYPVQIFFKAQTKEFGYMNKRFELEEMSREDRCSAVDHETGLHCIWEKGKFNETQEFIWAKKPVISPSGIAKTMRELGDWLAENHRELL